MKIHHVALAVIFISMVVLGTTAYLNGLGSENSATVDLTSLDRTSAALNNQTQTMNKTMNKLQEIKIDSLVDVIEIPYKLIQVGWYSTKTVFGSFNILTSMTMDVSKGLGDSGIALPSWLMPSIIAIISLVIIFILVFAFFKWKFED